MDLEPNVGSASYFTLPARVNLSPDSPTQMFRHNLRILRSLMTFLALSASGMFIASENRPILFKCVAFLARFIGHDTFISTEMKYNCLMSVISLARLGVSGDLQSGD